MLGVQGRLEQWCRFEVIVLGASTTDQQHGM